MKFIVKLFGELWRIAFLLFFALLFYSMTGHNLPSWAQYYLNLIFQLLEDWINAVIPITLLIAGIVYIKKVGWISVSEKVARYFQSNISDNSDFIGRRLSLSKVLFAISILFVIISLVLFNFELRKTPECKINLLKDKHSKCVFNSDSTSSIRIVVHSGANENTVNTKVPISIYITGDKTNASWIKVFPEAASTGGKGRYHSNLNYGIYDLPKNQLSTVNVEATDEVNKLKLFEVKIITNSNNWLMKIFSVMFLITLFLSIYFREEIFRKGAGRVLPYFLFSVLALFVLY